MKHELEAIRDFLLKAEEIRYFGEDNSLRCFVDMFFHGDLHIGDAPDFYISMNNEIMIVEHFEFDSYGVNRKGSIHRQELAKIERMNSKIPYTESGELRHVEMQGRTSYRNYIDNASRSFDDHYAHVDMYIDNLRKAQIINEKLEVKIVFLIEDVSPLGSVAVKYNGDDPPFIPMNLAFCKEFIELIENKDMVDYIIACSSYGNVNETWFIDLQQLEEYRKQAIDFAAMEFVDFSTHVLTYKRLIDLKE